MATGVTAVAGQARAGGRVLLLLSDPLNAAILRLLSGGPLPVSELSRRLGATSRTTRFNRLRELEALGVIAREKEGGSPPVTFCMLSPAGRQLLPTLRLFARWLSMSPSGPSRPDELSGALAIKALAEGWNATALRWLAERPRSLTELDAVSPPAVSYHEARKVRQAMSRAGLIAPVSSPKRGQPYAPTPWVRRSARCLGAAIRWEECFLAEGATPPTAIEAEALLLLLAPLIDTLPATLGGLCSLQVDRLGGISVVVNGGHVVSCTPELEQTRGCRVSGSAAAWLDALVEERTGALRMQGGIRLTTALVAGLHSTGP